MLIGILSDTHDRVDAARAGVELLRQQGAEFLIHCGDVGGQRIIDQLTWLPAAFVWGNNDWDRPLLQRYAEGLGVNCYGNYADLRLDGKRVAVTHGDDAKLIRQLLVDQEHDYLLLGHTHVRSDQREGRVRIINPGALHRAREKSVALLDTQTDRLTFHVVAI